ncbi:MAG: hypothetical protein K2Q18_13200 [Bdellovibrionales bacterium]|nr:hypothetical protein [Bdellovibrionales bacterium]
MLQAAITFFILGLFAMLLGVFGLFGVSVEFGEMILSVFFIFALMGFIGSAEVERKRHKDLH